MRLLRAHPVAILVAILAPAATAGCGSHNFSDSSPSTELLSGATAAAGSRIAPAGGPYSYRVPAHWHSISRFTVGSVSARTRYRSAIARGSGLIYVASSDRGSADPHALGMEYAKQLKQLGMSVESVSAALVGNSPAFVFDINDVPVPGGGTGSARRILIFTPQAIINLTCQWTDQADQKTTLAGCDSVRSSMRVSSGA